MDRKTYFFIGHREASEDIFLQLSAEIERHITEYGVTDFVVGRYGRFDSMAAHCVKAAKELHPEVTLTLLLPYHPYDRPTPTPPGFDGTFYPPGMETVPKRAAIVRANRYMVEHSDYLIAYLWHSVGNAWDLVEYAKKREQQGKISISILPRCWSVHRVCGSTGNGGNRYDKY